MNYSSLSPSLSNDPSSNPDDTARAAAEAFDRNLQVAAARITGGLSPISMALAATDWLWHLGFQPANSSRLAAQAQRLAITWIANAMARTDTVEDTKDARFRSPEWQRWPYAALANGQHNMEAWWREATTLHGMSPHNADSMRVFASQWLEALSPSNGLLTNPVVFQRTVDTLGGNLVNGLRISGDNWRLRHGLPPLDPSDDRFVPGVQVAITPGQVVYRNHLVELIQYSPVTDEVLAEPVFIVPSWIMKYYIMDLSPNNSMVRWLVSQGHTVFTLSWRNPDQSDAELTMDDYLQQGVFEPLTAIADILPDTAVHGCGYCLGGTLLAIAAAALARPGQVQGAAGMAPLRSVALLAAETDFTEPGQMGVLIDEAQIEQLEANMAERGFLSGPQMGGSFQFIHAHLWSGVMNELLMGERSHGNDLMTWNADSTRMPARMHSQYLRRCFLGNELALGRYQVEGRPVALSDIRLPMFVVGTETDHVSPWLSVYKIVQLTDTEITFVLVNGGHNAGIVSEPGHARRHYRSHVTKADDTWLPPAEWERVATPHNGSWWLAWSDWMIRYSSGRTPARTIDPARALEPAPGSYIHQKYND